MAGRLIELIDVMEVVRWWTEWDLRGFSVIFT